MQAVEVRRRLLGGGPGSGRYPKGSGGEQAAPAQPDAGAVSPEHLQKITQALKMHDYLHTGNYYDNDVAALHAIGLDSSKLDAMREVYAKWVVAAPSNVRRGMELAVTDPKAAPEEYRGEYEVTQAKLRMLYPGQKTITLYRGLNPSDETYTGDRAAWADSFQKMREADEAGKPIDIKSFGGADSWTDSPDTAQRFATGDGYVLSQKVPLSRVFGSYKTSDALGENEHEFVVVPQNHTYARTSVMHAAGEVVTISLDDFDPNWLHKQLKIEAGGPGSGRYPKGSGGDASLHEEHRQGILTHDKKTYDALAHYVSSDYLAMNTYLRGDTSGDVEIDKYDKVYAGRLQHFLSEAELPQSVHLYRGVAEGYTDMFMNAAPGSVIQYQGFLSTTASPEVANEFAYRDGRGAVLQIEAPKGAHAVAAARALGVDPNDTIDQRNREKEYVFASGTKLRVNSVDLKSRTADVEVVA